MTWFSPLVWKIYKNRDKPIAESDVWECSVEEGTEINAER